MVGGGTQRHAGLFRYSPVTHAPHAVAFNNLQRCPINFGPRFLAFGTFFPAGLTADLYGCSFYCDTHCHLAVVPTITARKGAEHFEH